MVASSVVMMAGRLGWGGGEDVLGKIVSFVLMERDGGELGVGVDGAAGEVVVVLKEEENEEGEEGWGGCVSWSCNFLRNISIFFGLFPLALRVAKWAVYLTAVLRRYLNARWKADEVGLSGNPVLLSVRSTLTARRWTSMSWICCSLVSRLVLCRTMRPPRSCRVMPSSSSCCGRFISRS